MSFFFGLLFVVATIIFIAGLAVKIARYARTPAPLKIATTPAPTSKTGVVMRLFREVVFFESLFKGTKWTWLFSWMFHLALMLVLIRHLRYFIDPAWVPGILWSALELAQPFGKYAGFAMAGGLGGLFLRRILVDRVRYISAPSDYLMLILLMLIGASGLMMSFVGHTDIVAIKQFFTFAGGTLPADPPLLIHLFLVAVLMIIFPFSKLLHVPGVFFSPTRNQVDNPREQRHIAPWAKALEEQEQN
jgi:nitrate reductase gamma subunit